MTEVKESKQAAPATPTAPVAKERPMLKMGNLTDGFYTDLHQVVIAGQVHFAGKQIKPTKIQKGVIKGIVSAGTNRETGAINIDNARNAAREAILAGYRILAATYPEMSLKLRDQQGDEPEGAIIAAQKNVDGIC